jgi:hypothetical protein
MRNNIKLNFKPIVIDKVLCINYKYNSIIKINKINADRIRWSCRSLSFVHLHSVRGEGVPNSFLYMYNTQNHWVSGLCPSFGILKTREHNFSETESVPFLRWGGVTTLLDPLERVNPSHWTIQVIVNTTIETPETWLCQWRQQEK